MADNMDRTPETDDAVTDAVAERSDAQDAVDGAPAASGSSSEGSDAEAELDSTAGSDSADGSAAAEGARKAETARKAGSATKTGRAHTGGNPQKGTKRSIEAAKQEKARAKKPAKVKGLTSPRWWAPLMVTLMVVGLLIVVSAYIFQGNVPVPGWGNKNVFLGFGVMITGFLMTLGWK